MYLALTPSLLVISKLRQYRMQTQTYSYFFLVLQLRDAILLYIKLNGFHWMALILCTTNTMSKTYSYVCFCPRWLNMQSVDLIKHGCLETSGQYSSWAPSRERSWANPICYLHNVSFPYEFCGDLGKTLYFIFVRPKLRSKESNFVFNFYLMRSKGSRRVQQYGSINDILWQLYIFGPFYAQISPNMFKRLPRSLNFQCLWRCFAQTNGILKRSQFSTQKLIIPHVC